MDDVFGVGDEGSEPSTHARQRGAIKAKLEHGFLDAVAPGFECFGDAQPSFIVAMSLAMM